MLKRIFPAVFLMVIGVMAAGVAAPAFHVSTSGNDTWSGTLPEPDAAQQDGPFATLQRARDAIRTLTPEARADARIYVHGGAYFLTEPLTLGPEDSGTETQPVVWQAWNEEPVRLAGGVAVKGFTKADDTGVMVCDFDGGAGINQLFFNSERQDLARWPNRGEGELPGGGWAFIAEAMPGGSRKEFIYDGDRPSGWASTEGIEISIWPNYNWWQTIAPVAAIDTAQKKITLKEDISYTIEAGRRYFYRNVREELDAPGEWYYDSQAKKLYFLPPSSIEEGEAVVPMTDGIVQAEGAAYINLIGFTFEACRQTAVTFSNCTGCMLAKSVLRNTGAFAVSVNGGVNVRIRGNDIYHTGRGGISLNGGDRKTLEPAGHQAINNHIHHFGDLYQTYQTAVNVSGVGNLVANNLIHDAPHIAILLGGNEHIIEYNEIHHVCMQGSDNGGFYMGRDWTQRGNIIRYNAFHDIYGFGLAGLNKGGDGAYHYESPHQAWGIYLDDCSSGTMIYGNLFYRVPLCGVMIGGGRDNVVKNNIFAECIPALHIDDRWDAYCWDLMYERLNAMNYKEPPYSKRYPELLTMGDDPRRPENNRFERNIIWYSRDDFRGLSTTAPGNSAILYDFDQFDPASTTINSNLIWHDGQPVRVAWSVYKEDGSRQTLTWEEWQEKGFDKDSIIEDPEFANPAEDDYQLNVYSPACKKIGFERLPISRMGLIDTELRASWPPPEDNRREGVEHHDWPITIGAQPAPPALPAAPAQPETPPPASQPAAAPATAPVAE